MMFFNSEEELHKFIEQLQRSQEIEDKAQKAGQAMKNEQINPDLLMNLRACMDKCASSGLTFMNMEPDVSGAIVQACKDAIAKYFIECWNVHERPSETWAYWLILGLEAGYNYREKFGKIEGMSLYEKDILPSEESDAC